jgi:hypothetical protein
MRHVLNFKNKKAVPQHCFDSYRESGLVQHAIRAIAKDALSSLYSFGCALYRDLSQHLMRIGIKPAAPS